MLRMIAAFALLLFAGPASAQTASQPKIEGPVAIVRSLYPVEQAHDWHFSARLEKLHAAAEANGKKQNEAVAGVDFGFQVNGNDAAENHEKTLKLVQIRNDGRRARVRVTLQNFKPVELDYDLVFENGGWRIDEVRSLREPRWVLSRLYMAGAKEK